MSAQPAQIQARQAAAAAPSQPVKELIIPVQMTDLSVFDDTFVFLKDKFSEQMRRVDEQMFQLGMALTNFNLKTTPTLTPSQTEQTIADWETITSSPLVQGDGKDKTLKLQFDVSQFEPEEVTVQVADDLLTVSARHEEKNDKYSMSREYNRQFLLPRGTNPAAVVSSLSRDGVLTVQAPLIAPERKITSAASATRKQPAIAK